MQEEFAQQLDSRAGRLLPDFSWRVHFTAPYERLGKTRCHSSGIAETLTDIVPRHASCRTVQDKLNG